jgi:hypothetical protein
MILMHLRRFFVSLFGIVTLLLLTPARPLHAAPNQEDEVILGGDLTLHAEEHIDGDLVIIGGDLNMRSGSHVTGSVTVLGGRVEINGTVEGDLVAVGGDITLGANARIQRDVIALGGRVHRAEGAQTGKVVEGLVIRNLRFWQGLPLPLLSPSVGTGPGYGIWATVATLVGALIIAMLGAAISTFWPTQTTQVTETILTAPLPSLGIGCLLYPLVASLTVFILLTICLAPFAPVVILLAVAATLFGWVALGRLSGRQLARWAGWRGATPLAATGVGVFALTVLAAVAGAIPCLGPILVIGVASIGMGAVALSRFGTSPYRSPSAEPPAEA